MSNNIATITYNGLPVTQEHFASEDDWTEHRVYSSDLRDADTEIQAPFSGPYDLDVKPVENGFELTLSAEANAITVALPARPWLKQFRDRAANIDEHYRTIRCGTAAEIVRQEGIRRAHHNASAELLQETLQNENISIDFTTARNLFGTIAQLLKPVVINRGPGAGSDLPPR